MSIASSFAAGLHRPPPSYNRSFPRRNLPVEIFLENPTPPPPGNNFSKLLPAWA
jgi:hypothetical protein